MTLCITIANQHGIWQSADDKLIDRATGLPVPDSATKHVSIRTREGSCFVAYAGVGSLCHLETSDWIRRTIRSESLTLNEALELIRVEATRTLSPHSRRMGYHFFTIGAFLNRRPWAAVITNASPVTDWRAQPPQREFSTIAERADAGVVLFGGESRAIHPDDLALLEKIRTRKPSKPSDYLELLAKVTSRAASHPTFGKVIGTGCMTGYMPPKEDGMEHKAFNWKGKDRIAPKLLFGIDLTDWMQSLMDAPPDEPLDDKKLEQAIQEGLVRRKGWRDNSPATVRKP